MRWPTPTYFWWTRHERAAQARRGRDLALRGEDAVRRLRLAGDDRSPPAPLRLALGDLLDPDARPAFCAADLAVDQGACEKPSHHRTGQRKPAMGCSGRQ